MTEEQTKQLLYCLDRIADALDRISDNLDRVIIPVSAPADDRYYVPTWDIGR
jgi:hypothetical protein